MLHMDNGIEFPSRVSANWDDEDGVVVFNDYSNECSVIPKEYIPAFIVWLQEWYDKTK